MYGCHPHGPEVIGDCATPTARRLHGGSCGGPPHETHAIRIALACACFLALTSPGHVARADHDKTKVDETTTTTTTTTTTGTVTRIGPDTFVVQTTDSPDTMTFGQSRTTTYVDENGKLVPYDTIQTGAPVTVYYDTSDSGDRTATRVIVKKTTVRHYDDQDED